MVKQKSQVFGVQFFFSYNLGYKENFKNFYPVDQ